MNDKNLEIGFEIGAEVSLANLIREIEYLYTNNNNYNDAINDVIKLIKSKLWEREEK